MVAISTEHIVRFFEIKDTRTVFLPEEADLDSGLGYVKTDSEIKGEAKLYRLAQGVWTKDDHDTTSTFSTNDRMVIIGRIAD